MCLEYNKNLKLFSRNLRNNMTQAERKLWSRIRKKQINNYQFYRQKPIGNYIADFYCPKLKLVIEVDGSQHYTEEGINKDKIREELMDKLGIKTLRFSNNEVLENIEGVIEQINLLNSK